MKNKYSTKKTIIMMWAIFLALFVLQMPVQATSGTVKLAKKTMKLQVTVNSNTGVTSRQSTKLKLKQAKSVKKVKVTYKSNRPKVAKVSSKGKVTAMGQGTAIITVKVKYKHHLNHKWHRKVLKQKVVVKKNVIKPKSPAPKPNPKPNPDPKPKFHYIHNPELNPKAMADIIKNEDAIYGFSPNPVDGRIKEFAKYDWTDPDVVAGARESRIAYHKSIASMYTMVDEMKAQGKSMEEIARATSKERNRIRIDSYKGDPEGLAALKESNLRTYGNEDGPTPDQLFKQYGSWETVLEKAFNVNMGMDACCGLYDDYYQLYVELGLITDLSTGRALSERNIFDRIYRICELHKSV